MIKPVGEQISPGCSTAGLLRAFNSLTHKTSMGGRASCCINACKNTLWKPIMTPGSSQHRGVHAWSSNSGHGPLLSHLLLPSLLTPGKSLLQDPCTYPPLFREGPGTEPHNSFPHLLPVTISRTTPLAILSKTVSTAIPIAHSALGLRYFFVKVSPPATGCLFVHCLSPTPSHGNVGSVTEGPCTSAHCAQCTAQGLGHAKCSVNTD